MLNNLKFLILPIYYSMQAIYRKAKSLGVATKYNSRDNPEGHVLLRKFINLALLPPQKVREALDHIKDEVRNTFGKKHQLMEKWRKFFDYFERQWMTSITPECFSVYNCPDRTNNFLESYHRTINSSLGGRKTICQFLGRTTSFFFL